MTIQVPGLASSPRPLCATFTFTHPFPRTMGAPPLMLSIGRVGLNHATAGGEGLGKKGGGLRGPALPPGGSSRLPKGRWRLPPQGWSPPFAPPHLTREVDAHSDRTHLGVHSGHGRSSPEARPRPLFESSLRAALPRPRPLHSFAQEGRAARLRGHRQTMAPAGDSRRLSWRRPAAVEAAVRGGRGLARAVRKKKEPEIAFSL